MDKINQSSAQADQEGQQPDQSQRKRSKRHRTHRNIISDKSRVESVKEFGAMSRQWEKNYRNRYPKQVNLYPPM